MKLKAAVLVTSDRCFRGEREDKSGPAAREFLEGKMDADVLACEVLPDEPELIREKILHYIEKAKVDLVVTSGGTGIGPRDCTADVTRELVEKTLPGMAEEMRRKSLEKTPYAMLSRALVGIRGKSFIVNVPGKPAAVRDCLEAILPAMRHAIEVLYGKAKE